MFEDDSEKGDGEEGPSQSIKCLMLEEERRGVKVVFGDGKIDGEKYLGEKTKERYKGGQDLDLNVEIFRLPSDTDTDVFLLEWVHHQRKTACEWNYLIIEASTRIQSAWRGFKVRKHITTLRKSSAQLLAYARAALVFRSVASKIVAWIDHDAHTTTNTKPKSHTKKTQNAQTLQHSEDQITQEVGAIRRHLRWVWRTHGLITASNVDIRRDGAIGPDSASEAVAKGVAARVPAAHVLKSKSRTHHADSTALYTHTQSSAHSYTYTQDTLHDSPNTYDHADNLCTRFEEGMHTYKSWKPPKNSCTEDELEILSELDLIRHRVASVTPSRFPQKALIEKCHSPNIFPSLHAI